MAEFVQLRKEKWVEPLSSLVQLELLTQDELRSVLFNLDKFENKVQSQTRKLEDILAYIQFECYLLLRLKELRKSRKQYDLTEEIDRFIYNEIRAQFGSAEINFSHSIDFWNAKLRFIANIVPDQDKESEFNLLFKKALNYCGRADLEIYKSCVDYLWSFFRRPSLTVNPKKRRKLAYRRDVSKLMHNIRYITNKAFRNFSGDPDASIWILTTELKYLQVLREEEELCNGNSKIHTPFDIQNEIEKAEKLIDIFYRDLVKRHSETPSIYIQLYEAIRLLPLMEARELSKRAYSLIILIKNRTPEMFSWLIGRSIDDNKFDEFKERINQALSSTHPKLKMLELCIEKLDCFLEKLDVIYDPENCLPRLLQFYTRLLHKDNPEWNQVSSEALHTSRIQMIKRLPKLMDTLADNSDDKCIADLQSFQNDHDLEKTVKYFVKRFPSSLVLVKERIIQILSQSDEDKVKPKTIQRYLSQVNWKLCKNDDGLRLLQFIYYAFITMKKMCRKSKLNDFLLISPNTIPEMDEIRLMHLKKSYMEELSYGREFYKNFRLLTSDWRFACEAVKIETTACRSSKKYSDVLLLAYQDAVRLADTSSTEPWKVCIMSKHELGRKKEASDLVQRALKTFSSNGINTADLHTDLLLISKKLAIT